MNHQGNAALNKYCSKVKKCLVCSPTTKEKLVSGLYNELLEETAQDLDYASLVSKLGKPEELAHQLQESVDEQDYLEGKKRKQRKQRISIAVIVIVALLIAAASLSYAYHIWNGTPAYYTETIWEGTSLPEGAIIVD